MNSYDSDRWAEGLSLVRTLGTESSHREPITAELPGIRPAAPFNRRVSNGFYRSHRQQVSLGLRLAVTLLLDVFVIASIGLIAIQLSPRWFAQLRNTTPTRHVPRRSAATSSISAPSVETSATISSISPNVGVTGQRIVVRGTNIMSTNGQIVARFGTKIAPTDCTTANQCLVTVPPAPSRNHTVAVRLEVGTGHSNAVTFRYR
jgi:hypothetical protein